MDIDNSFIDVTANEIDLDNLKDQLEIYNNKASTELQKANNNNSVATSTLKSIYNGINEKYGLSVTYDDFQTFIQNIASKDKITLAVEDLVGKQVVNTIATRTKIDLMTSLGFIIQKIMYLSVKEVEMADSLTPEIVGIAEKMMSWFSTFSQIQEESKVSDFDKSMSNIVGDSGSSSTNINRELIDKILKSFSK